MPLKPGSSQKTISANIRATTLITYVFYGFWAPWQWTRFYIDTPSAGTHTYTLVVNADIDPSETGQTRNYTYVAMEVEQLKR